MNWPQIKCRKCGSKEIQETYGVVKCLECGCSKIKSDERGFCGKCEERYEPYTVLIPDSVVDLSGWMSMKEKYGWFCFDCFKEEHPDTSIAILRNSSEGSQEGGGEDA